MQLCGVTLSYGCFVCVPLATTSLHAALIGQKYPASHLTFCVTSIKVSPAAAVITTAGFVSSSSKRDLNTGHMKGSVQGRLHSSTWLKWVGSIHVTVNIADIVNISPVPTANCWLQTMFQHHVCKQYTQQISGGKSILTDVCFLAGVGGRSRGAAPQRGSVLCPHSAGQHHSRHAHMEVKLRAVLPGFK